MPSLVKVLTLVLVSHISVSLPVAAQNVDPEMRALIEEVLEVTGSDQLADQVAEDAITAIFNGMQSRNPNFSERAQEIMQEEFLVLFKGQQEEMNAQIVGFYARHFTLDEMKQMLDFYKSPLGIKTIEVMPLMIQEMVASSEVMGARLVSDVLPRIEQRFKDEGISRRVR